MKRIASGSFAPVLAPCFSPEGAADLLAELINRHHLPETLLPFYLKHQDQQEIISSVTAGYLPTTARIHVLQAKQVFWSFFMLNRTKIEIALLLGLSSSATGCVDSRWATQSPVNCSSSFHKHSLMLLHMIDRLLHGGFTLTIFFSKALSETSTKLSPWS